MSLKNKTYSAVRWTTVAAGVRALLQIAQIMVLARLLSPADYGLMGIVGVVMTLAIVFSDMGINSAYVQRQDVTSNERSSLFWLNVVINFLLTVLVISLSPLMASWFGDERLTSVLMLAAFSFVIGALGQQVRMSAEKNLNFRPLVVLETVAAMVGFAVALTGALLGWGVYALVWGTLTTAAMSTSLAWIFLSRGWRPGWHFRWLDVRSYLGFGGSLVANNLVNEVNRNIDLLLGGRMLDSSALGLYSLPRQIILQIQGMVNPIITRVGFPLIAQVQSDIPMVRSIYLKTLNMTSSVNAPVYLGIAFFAPEIIHLILGDKWAEAVGLLPLLALWGFLRSTGNPVGSLLLGMGRADLSLKWNLLKLVIVPPVVWFGSLYGTVGIASALVAYSVVIFVPTWLVLVRPLCHAGFVEYLVAVLRPFLIALISVSAAFYLAGQFEGLSIRLLIGVMVTGPVYLLLSYKLNNEWYSALRVLVTQK